MLGGSAGVRILWVWTLGTAGVLCTAVVKRRMQDMEALMNKQTEVTAISAEITGEQIEGEFGTEDEKSTKRHEVHL